MASRPASARLAGLLGVGLAVLLLGSPPAVASGPPLSGSQRVIVRLRPGAVVATAAAREHRLGSVVRARFVRTIHGYAATVTSDRLEALRHDPRVQSVVPDTVIHALDEQLNPPWGLDRLDQRALALDGVYHYDTTGDGVVAFVVDTGVRATHSQLAGRVLPGHDFVDGDNAPDDCDGHGTHVAGTIGGVDYGVAKLVSIEPLRVLDCAGYGYESDAIAALDWVLAHKPAGPAVANLSVGGPASPLMDEAVERVVAAGVAVVVAAGNDATDACGDSPGRTPGAITVGATDETDARASFSDYGSCIDIFAPGQNIRSAWIGSNTASAVVSGTSMAAPHVTGAIARYLQGHPAASPNDVAAWLQATSTPGIVTQSLSPNGDLLYTGTEPQPPRPTPPSVTPPTVSGSVNPPTITVDGTAAQTYTVSVTVSSPVSSRLTARITHGESSDYLMFDNPSGDGQSWTAAGQVPATGPAGVWAVTDFSALWTDATGTLTTTTFPTSSPITLQVVAKAPPAASSPPPGRSPVRITFVRWDPAGPDRGRNLVRELVRLRNTSNRPVDLSRFTLRDRQGHVFRFPKFQLAPGATVTVHTGRGTRSAAHLYWNRRVEVWGNTSDTVYLRDPGGKAVDTARWNRPGQGHRAF